MGDNKQRITKRQLTLYTVLGLALFWALFNTFKVISLKKELENEVAKEKQVENRVKRYQDLQRIDSILVQGDYNTALQAYNQEYQNKDLQDVEGVQLRIDLAKHLMRLGAGEAQNPALEAKKDSLDSIMATKQSSPGELRQVDSLNFALEKAHIQLASLRKRLQQKSFGEYLTFTNSKGSQMHYVGQVKQGKANGYGMALLNTGSRYVGQWKNNQRHGEGSFYWADGEYYLGHYENDKRTGEGTYYWPNGEKYVGHWKDDKRSGEGVFYAEDGEVVTSGTWKGDKLINKEKGRKP